MTDPLIHDARALADTNPTLMELIRFTRSHDPTDDFRQRWGESFEARRDDALARARRWCMNKSSSTRPLPRTDFSCGQVG